MKKTRVLTGAQFDALSEKWISQEIDLDEYYPIDTALVVFRRNVICADMHTQCKTAKTVVKRFFQQLNALCNGYEKFESIAQSAIKGWDGKGYLKEDERSEGYVWSIENLEDDEWYIFLNIDMTTNQEFKELEASIVGPRSDQPEKSEPSLSYIKVNMPETFEDYISGNGEGVWALVDAACKKAHDSDSSEGTYIGIICNNSIYYPRMRYGMAVVIEMRGSNRPVVPYSFLNDFGEYLRSETE